MDDVEFAKIYDNYRKLIWSICRSFWDNPTDAEDAVMEVFFRAWRARASYDKERGEIVAWLRRITYNYCIQRLRQQMHYPTVSLRSFETLESLPEALILNPDTTDFLQLKKCLGSLLPFDRLLVLIKYEEDCSWTEMADRIEGYTVSQLRYRVQLAIRQLRQCLDECG